jgi:hypothetical protein
MCWWPAADFFRCPQCELLFRHPLPASGELSKLYGRGWADPEQNLRETGGTDLLLARLFAAKLAASLGLRDFSGMRLLEFGAGRGAMLQVLQDLGAETVAVEPFGHEYLRRKGFEVFSDLKSLPQNQRFDGVITLDTIEHLAEPWVEAGQLQMLLKPGGWLFVSTPNARGLNARISRDQWREAHKPGHIVLFTPESLRRILHGCGFGRVERLQWFFGYTSNRLRTCRDLALQLLRLDGELRYLAFKMGSNG